MMWIQIRYICIILLLELYVISSIPFSRIAFALLEHMILTWAKYTFHLTLS